MAKTTRRTSGALAVAQTSTITVAGTWAGGDTATVTIGVRDLVLTVGTDTTTDQVAQAIQEMISGDDQTGTGDHTFSDTGDNVPEFSEVTATVSGSVVTLTGVTKGVPFTVTASEDTAGDGTATAADVTAAAGPEFWGGADNWDNGVPVSTDTVHIDNIDTDIKYGLDQSAVTLAALYIPQSFTGTLGLPMVNEAGNYPEYRDTYFAVTATILQIGAGGGTGSGRIRIDGGSGQTAFTVFNSGSARDDVPAVVWKGTHASNALVQTGGDVGVAVYGGEVATLATVTKSGGSLLCGAGTTLSGALTNDGGDAAYNSLIDGSLTTLGGAVVIEGTGNVDQLTVNGGTVVYSTTGTLGGNTVVAGDGVLDFSQNPAGKTVTNPIDLFGTAARVLDPLKVVASLVVDGNRGADAGTQVVWGSNYRLTRAATA